MTSLKTSIKTITYLSDIGCLEIQGASLLNNATNSQANGPRSQPPIRCGGVVVISSPGLRALTVMPLILGQIL